MTNVNVVLGGAGFVGTNLAAELAEQGESVRVLDNLSRPGVEQNLNWLCGKYPSQVEFCRGDVRDEHAVRAVLRDANSVFHFAAQVAVTASLVDPVLDFETNARGTLHVLEALRHSSRPAALVYTSTNKVYGRLERVALVETSTRYVPRSKRVAEHGIGEAEPLDFHSPYGCSKGAADQYVRDYARCYGLSGVVLRMSCIYGPHQAGNEDQGWVAHFCRSALEKRPMIVFGDGKQVRDVLHVSDLVDALLRARQHAATLAGRVFNIGGGPAYSMSLRELIVRLEHLSGKPLNVRYTDWRAGDQRYYASDTTAFRRACGWRPRIDPDVGVERLTTWFSEHAFQKPLPKAARAIASAALVSSK